MEGNVNKCIEKNICKKNCLNNINDVHVNSIYSEADAPDIRECLALFLLEREYGMDAKLKRS